MYIIILIIGALLALLGAARGAELGDISLTVQLVGNPHLAQWPDDTKWVYARNVRTMKLINAAPGGDIIPAAWIYLGAGSMDPDNAGPVYVTRLAVRPTFGCVDAITGNCGFFAYTPPLPTEEISNYVLMGNQDNSGQLIIPGIDQTAAQAPASSLGEYYTSQMCNDVDNSCFGVKRGIPGALHNFDMICATGNPCTKLLMAGGMVLDLSASGRSFVQSSIDGNTWTDLTCDSVPCPQAVRMYRFFTLAGNIYVTGKAGIYQYQVGTNNLLKQCSIGACAMLPNSTYWIWTNAPWASGLVYLAGKLGGALDGMGSPGHFTGERLMYATAVGTASTVTLPVSGVIPRDLRVIAGKVYLLSDHDETSNVYTIYLHKSSDLSGSGNWTEVFHFQSIPPGGIAQSFEHVPGNGTEGSSGYFYIGMGTLYKYTNGAPDMRTLSNISGAILRIAYTPS